MTVALWVCIAILVTALILILVRLERGPSSMDRAVALDVAANASIGLAIVWMALTFRLDLLPLLVAFVSVGFLGSVTIARFFSQESPDERRLLTDEQEAAEDAAGLALNDDAADIHDDPTDDEPDADADDDAPVDNDSGAETSERSGGRASDRDRARSGGTS